jgi:hypothetical protein
MAEKRTARRWFLEHRRRETMLAGFGGVAMIGGTFAAHFLAWYLYASLMQRPWRAAVDEARQARIRNIAWAMVAFTYPIYFLIGRERVEQPADSWNGRGPSWVPMTRGRHAVLLVILSIAMLAPAAVLLMVSLFNRWRKLASISDDELASIFVKLWKEDGKVPSSVLFAEHDEADATRLGAQLRLFDGINFLPSGEAGYAIGSELRGEIREWKKKDPE